MNQPNDNSESGYAINYRWLRMSIVLGILLLGGYALGLIAHLIVKYDNSWLNIAFTMIFALSIVVAAILTHRGLKKFSQTNEKLAVAVARTRAIVDTAAESILVTDEKGVIQSANLAAEKLFQYPVDEIVGKDISDLIPDLRCDKDSGSIHDYPDGKSFMVLDEGCDVYGRRGDGMSFPMHIGISRSQVGDRISYTGIIWDLSDEKEREIRIVESERELSNILQNMQDTFYRTDVNGDLIRISPSVESLLGYMPEELVGTRLADLYVEPDGREKFLAALQNNNGKIEHYEAPLRHKNGDEVWVSTNAHVVKDEEGHIAGVEGTSRDISEQRFMENALRESEGKFRTLAESSNAGIFIYQGKRLVYANEAESRLTGYSNDELLQMDFWQMIHPDFLDTARKWAEDERLGKPVPSNRELKLLTKDGDSLWVEYSGTLVDYNNEPAGMGTIIDITHLKQAEEKLRYAKDELELRVKERTENLSKLNKELKQEIEERERAEQALRDKATIIDQIHESVISTDLEGNITSWNKGAEKLLGYSAEQMLGKYVGSIYPEEDREFLLKEVIRPLQEKGTYETEVRMLRKSGEIFPGLLSLSMLFDSKGNPSGMIGYALDITKRKRAEEKIEHDYLAQSAINAILKTSLEQLELKEQLELALDQLFLVPRLSRLTMVSIFITDNPDSMDSPRGNEPSTSMRHQGNNIAGHTVVVKENPGSESRQNGPGDKSKPSGAYVSLPILSMGKLLGTLDIDLEHSETLPAEDMDFLRVVANILAGIIERDRAQQSLTDALCEKNMIMDTVQDIIIRIGLNNRLFSWNKELEVVTGFSSDELTNAPPDLFFSGHDIPETYKIIERCLSEGYAYAEIDLIAKNGIKIPYQWALSSLTDSNGNLLGFTGVGRDLSDRIEAERQRLADAERQRDNLVREVHHRVKNNLQGIVGLLRHYTLENPETREVLENAISQIHSMALMYGLQSKHADDDVLLADMTAAIAENAQSLTSGTVSIGQIDSDCRSCAVAGKDSVAVALIINELIFNGIKHTPGAVDKAVNIEFEFNGARALVRIASQGSLPAGFDWTAGKGLGTGLTLIKSLIPKRGASVAITDANGMVLAELSITAPLLVLHGATNNTVAELTARRGQVH
jgi:PAS domain S-box-containing protein